MPEKSNGIRETKDITYIIKQNSLTKIEVKPQGERKMAIVAIVEHNNGHCQKYKAHPKREKNE